MPEIGTVVVVVEIVVTVEVIVVGGSVVVTVEVIVVGGRVVIVVTVVVEGVVTVDVMKLVAIQPEVVNPIRTQIPRMKLKILDFLTSTTSTFFILSPGKQDNKKGSLAALPQKDFLIIDPNNN